MPEHPRQQFNCEHYPVLIRVLRDSLQREMYRAISADADVLLRAYQKLAGSLACELALDNPACFEHIGYDEFMNQCTKW